MSKLVLSASVTVFYVGFLSSLVVTAYLNPPRCRDQTRRRSPDRIISLLIGATMAAVIHRSGFIQHVIQAENGPWLNATALMYSGVLAILSLYIADLQHEQYVEWRARLHAYRMPEF